MKNKTVLVYTLNEQKCLVRPGFLGLLKSVIVFA